MTPIPKMQSKICETLQRMLHGSLHESPLENGVGAGVLNKGILSQNFYYTKDGKKGPREMALSVKCLLPKNEYLSSGSQHLCEKAGRRASVCNLSTGNGRYRGSVPGTNWSSQ